MTSSTSSSLEYNSHQHSHIQYWYGMLHVNISMSTSALQNSLIIKLISHDLYVIFKQNERNHWIERENVEVWCMQTSTSPCHHQLYKNFIIKHYFYWHHHHLHSCRVQISIESTKRHGRMKHAHNLQVILNVTKQLQYQTVFTWHVIKVHQIHIITTSKKRYGSAVHAHKSISLSVIKICNLSHL